MPDLLYRKVRLSGELLRGVAALLLLCLCFPRAAQAGAQQYEPLSAAVRTALSAAISDSGPPKPSFDNFSDRLAYLNWLGEMAERLKTRSRNARRENIRQSSDDADRDYLTRRDFLETVWYESHRAGLEPALVLGLIQVESGFHKHAVSPVGARGYTQVMPFWARLIGDGDARKLFDMRVNIRFGCVILRYYLDIERGDVFRALGRYNGSLGQAEYPNMVLGAWRKWEYATPAPIGKAAR